MIRPLTDADLQPFRALRRRGLVEDPTAFGSSFEEEDAYTDAFFAARFLHGSPASAVLGAWEGERLVGLAGLHHLDRPKTRHRAMLWGMYIPVEHRRKGLGRALVQAAVDHARGIEGLLQVHLTVTAENEPALRLYEQAGFVRHGREPRSLRVEGRFYDEILMVLRLDGP